MCLYTLNNKCTRAKQDIICYKIVRINISTGRRESLVVGAKLPDPLVGFIDKAKSITHFEIDCFNPRIYYVNVGKIHTFTECSDAVYKFSSELTSYKELELWRCIIPKGTYYVTGNTPSDHAGFASNRLKYETLLLHKKI